MTGLYDFSGACAPVVVPEEELAVFPVPVCHAMQGENLLVRAAEVARRSGLAEAEAFFLRDFDTIYDDSSLFVDAWDIELTAGAPRSVLHLAGMVYSGCLSEVEELIESGQLVNDLNHLYLVARYYETQGCLPALQRTLHTLQCIKDTAIDQNDPQFNKFLFRKALCDEWYFGKDGLSELKQLYLDDPQNEVLLNHLRRIVLSRDGQSRMQSPNILITAFHNKECTEEQFSQLRSLTGMADPSQWQAFIDYVRTL